MLDFTSREVLVVGGSSGIGLATAAAAANLGAQVTIAARNKDKVEAAAAQIGATPAVLDTTDPEAVAAYFAAAPVFDHVVVTASALGMGPVRDLPLETAYAAMESKFWGAYRVARAARIAPGGSLTLTSGYLSVRPAAGRALLSAINAALEGLVRGLALEFAPVRVNAVSPGLIETPIWSTMAEEARAAMFEGARKRLPAGIVGQADHVALQILALMANPYMTGSTVFVDGGGVIA